MYNSTPSDFASSISVSKAKISNCACAILDFVEPPVKTGTFTCKAILAASDQYVELEVENLFPNPL